MTRPYVTAHRLAALDAGLSPRDRSLLVTLARVRLATSAQLRRLHFTDVTRRQANATLERLTDRGLVARLPRIMGGARAGSAGFVYGLTIAGRRLVAGTDRRRYQPWGVGLPFLAHRLAITELYVQLLETNRSGGLDLTDFTSEPGCWRAFDGPGGSRVVLKPDAHAVLAFGRFEDRWFIEVDRGTESGTALARKCDVYRQYWQSGVEQARHHIFPRVLWLVLDDHRRTTLIEVLGRQPEQAWPLFAVALFDEAVARISRGAHE
jgi:hypothetical protein